MAEVDELSQAALSVFDSMRSTRSAGPSTPRGGRALSSAPSAGAGGGGGTPTLGDALLAAFKDLLGDLYVDAARLEFISELGVGELALVERGLYHPAGGGRVRGGRGGRAAAGRVEHRRARARGAKRGLPRAGAAARRPAAADGHGRARRRRARARAGRGGRGHRARTPLPAPPPPACTAEQRRGQGLLAARNRDARGPAHAPARGAQHPAAAAQARAPARAQPCAATGGQRPRQLATRHCVPQAQRGAARGYSPQNARRIVDTRARAGTSRA